MNTKALIFLVALVMTLGFSSCSKMDPLTSVSKGDGNSVSRAKNSVDPQNSGNSGSNGGGSNRGEKERLEEEITDPGGGDDDEKPASTAQ